MYRKKTRSIVFSIVALSFLFGVVTMSGVSASVAVSFAMPEHASAGELQVQKNLSLVCPTHVRGACFLCVQSIQDVRAETVGYLQFVRLTGYPLTRVRYLSWAEITDPDPPKQSIFTV